jgi:hypothetical protein
MPTHSSSFLPIALGVIGFLAASFAFSRRERT